MRTFILFILLSTIPLTSVFAQKKEISTASDQVKSGKNLDKAEQSMLKLLENPANKQNEKIYRLLNAAIQKQYEQLNEKMYLKQNIDTASMFLTLNRAFKYAFITDSVHESFRKKNGEFLSKYIPNLYTGGMYFFNKKKYSEAYSLFDMYISSKNRPLLENGRQNVKRMKPAAFRALCCGYQLDDFAKTVKHKKQALMFKQGKALAMKYLAETYQKNDSTFGQYIEVLDSGFHEFPCEEYFYTHLINHKLSGQHLFEAAETIDTVLAKCSDIPALYHMKANIMLNLEKYEECIEAAEKYLTLSDSIDDIYYIAGMANLYIAEHKAQEVEEDGENPEAQAYLEAAMKYIEDYRKRCPERKDRWGTPLYHIYLNLNKGDEFEEISRILKQ